MKKIIALLFFLLFASSVEAATYWTSSSASSTTLTDCDGTSDPGTYCSFSFLWSNMAGGDTVIGKAGTYDLRFVNTNPKTGTASQKTTFTCETTADPPNGVAPVCIMRPVTTGSYVVLINSASYWRWMNWKFDSTGLTSHTCTFHTGSTDSPGNSKNWELINNEFKGFIGGDPGTGAVVCGSTENAILRNNEIWNCQRTGNPDCHGIYTSDNNMIFENNYLHDLGRTSPSNGNAQGVQYYNSGTKTWTGGIIRYNRIHTTNRCGVIGSGNTGVEIYGNVCFNILGGGGWTIHGASAKVYNNTVDAQNAGITTDQNCTGSTCVVRNNISVTSCSFGTATESNNSCSVTDTAHFIDPNNATMANRDYNLIEGAASIDSGTTTGLPSGYTCPGNVCSRGAHQAPKHIGTVIENATNTVANATFSIASQGIRNNVGLKGCTTANWAVVDNGTGKTENSCTIVGTSRADIGFTTAFTSGQSANDTIAYTRGTLTDNVNIGGLYSKVRTFSAVQLTNNVGGSSSTLEAVHYRCLSWYADTTPISTDWLRTEDSTVRCKFRKGGYAAAAVAITSSTAVSQSFDWYVGRNGGATAAMTNTCSTTTICFAGKSAPQLPDGAPLDTAILSDPNADYVGGAVIGQQASSPTTNFNTTSTMNAVLLVHSDKDTAAGDYFTVLPAPAGGATSGITQTKQLIFEVTN